MRTVQAIGVAVAACLFASAPLAQERTAPNVTHENVPGISNFARLETTIACAGATKAEAVPELKKMGFASIINVRESNEPGADVEKEEAAAKAAGLGFEHVPSNI